MNYFRIPSRYLPAMFALGLIAALSCRMGPAEPPPQLLTSYYFLINNCGEPIDYSVKAYLQGVPIQFGERAGTGDTALLLQDVASKEYSYPSQKFTLIKITKADSTTLISYLSPVKDEWWSYAIDSTELRWYMRAKAK